MSDAVALVLFGEQPPPPAPAPVASPRPARPGPPTQGALWLDESAQHPGQTALCDVAGAWGPTTVLHVDPPAAIPCQDCGRPLKTARSRRHGRGPQCYRDFRAASQRPPGGAALPIPEESTP